MHYVVYLIGRGWSPYRQIIDVNLPGTYFFEILAIKIFGDGALGLRMYDLALLVTCSASAIMIVSRKHWFAATFAAALFALIHIQDGIAQLSQRDLLLAALLVLACALLLKSKTGIQGIGASFTAGILIGSTFIIKPLYLPFGLLLVTAAAYRLRENVKTAVIQFGTAATGLLIPSVIALAYLHRQHAVSAFWQTLTGIIPLHASLGRKPLSYLLSHCLSPIEPVVLVWIATLFATRPKLTLIRLELLAGAIFSAVAYLLQGKGYPYHRYPLLLFLLLLIGLDLASAARSSNKTIRAISFAGLAIGCIVLAPMAAWKTSTYSVDTPFQSALASDLMRLGGQQLSGEVQCLDTFGGCINTMYDLRLLPASGFLYDCYLFTPSQNGVTAAYRNAFWNAYRNKPPRVIVVTSQFCFGAGSFNKVDNWPAFANELRSSYSLTEEWLPTEPQHWWSRKEFPSSFRIYIRNSGQ